MLQNRKEMGMELKILNKKVPDFNDVKSAFGAELSDYPNYDDFPKEYKSMRAPGCKVASSLFFKGGTLASHNLKLKEGVDAAAFHRALRAYLSSFAPSHQLKEATCGMLIDTYTEPMD